MSDSNPRASPRIVSLGLLAGPAVAALMLALPPPPGLSETGWAVAAIAALMAIWWVSEALPVAATALVPIIAFPLLGIADIKAAAAPYANPLIYLFLGGFLIALGVQRWNLHRRIALHIVRRVGTSPANIIAGFMLASALLSMWITNTATTAMMLPVALSLVQLTEGDANAAHAAPASRNFALALLLGIAYGATIGGLATLVGTAPNAMLAAFLSERYDITVGFVEWMAVGVPLTAIFLPLAWLLLTRLLFRVGTEPIAGGGALIERELEALGPMTGPEKRVAAVFAITAGLWIFRPLLAEGLPHLPLSDSAIALFGGLLLFVLPAGRLSAGVFLLDWEWAKRLPWGVLLLFGGGLSLADAIAGSGLAGWIGEGLVGLKGTPLLLLTLAIAGLIVFLTELTSNTATTATFLPIAGLIAASLGEPPMALATVTALAASCAFMLPVATPPNAIVFGTGRLTVLQMARAGLWLNAISIITIGALAPQLIAAVF